MEEVASGQCRVIYYCPGLSHNELYTPSKPPTPPSAQDEALSDHAYNNVRRLLDVDQGNFGQVFVSSLPEECLERLAAFAKFSPAAVLVEFSDATIGQRQSSAFSFLRNLLADVQTSKYQRQVLPFVLLATSLGPSGEQFAEAGLETSALDTIRSPLCSEAIEQLVGRVKEATRPGARSLGSDMAQSLVSSIVDHATPQIASHRPDEVLSAQRKVAVEEAIAKWQFPAHEFDMDELTYGALTMLEHVLRNSVLEKYRLPRPQLITFLLAARRLYRHEREVHYHNWRHAVDVTQSVYCFLCDVRLCPPSEKSRTRNRDVNALERILSPFDALILLVSAVGHDVGHPGVNNAFLVASNHQLAQMYNDKSVLENYHCAAYSQLVRRHWPALNEIAHFRSTMISTILATDMQRHFEYMGHLNELKQKVHMSQAELSDWTDKDREHARELVMALLIKAADISNVARPFEIAAQWAKILMNEFARQGELEKELQIPTCLFGGPPNKEDLLAAAQSQKGFMNLFGFPLFRGISEVMPNVSCTIPELEKNKEIWEKRITDEKARRTAAGDGRESPRTYGSVTENEVEEARTRKRESEPAPVPETIPQTPNLAMKRQVGSENSDGIAKHPASEQRQYLQLGVPAAIDEKRASTPALWPSTLQLSPTTGGSRRSSKDVALNHMQELSAFAQQSLAVGGSRRGSADASWQIHQGYPGSRRGSKEESLTTILVTSQGSPASRSVPGSPKVAKASSPARHPGPSKRQSTSKSTSITARESPQTSRPPAIGTSTAVTESSIQPAPATLSEEAVAPGTSDGTESATGDANALAGGWTFDGAPSTSAPPALPSTPPEPQGTSVKSDSPRIIARMSSRESESSRFDARHSDSHLRQSRSRSRLRGLKFWKKRKDIAGVETVPPDSPPP